MPCCTPCVPVIILWTKTGDSNNNNGLALLTLYANNLSKATHFVNRSQKKKAASVLFTLAQGDFAQAASMATSLLLFEQIDKDLALKGLCLVCGLYAANTSDQSNPKVDAHSVVAQDL